MIYYIDDPMKIHSLKLFKHISPTSLLYLATFVCLMLITVYYLHAQYLSSQLLNLNASDRKLKTSLDQTKKDLETLKNEDQFKRNEDLQKTIKSIETTYKQSVTTYELLIKLREQTNKTEDFDKKFTLALTQLSDRNYTSASATLASLRGDIQKKQSEIAAAFSIPANVPSSNAPPGSGYNRQQVNSEVGTFMVDIIAGDLNSTKVIVDTASSGDCGNDCPVMALGDYAARSGAYAGINGPYFCPASYPGCAGKTNSFDTLLMNKDKTYFNSDNNVYSTVPAVIFQGNSARFVGQSLEWGRDTGPDSVIASQPMLLSGGNVTYGGDDEVKRAGKGSRSFIGTKGNTVYIGVVYNANVAEVARVLKALGLEYALNLDSGGSTALWSGGRYLAGPGRATPFGILLVRK